MLRRCARGWMGGRGAGGRDVACGSSLLPVTLLPVSAFSSLSIGDDVEDGRGREGERRERKERGHWDSRENRKQFLEQVARKYNVQVPEDWKKVQVRDMQAMGGSGLLARHSHSLLAILQDAYPEVEWRAEEMSSRLPRGFWEKRERRQEFVERMREAKGISAPEDWHRVRAQDFKERGGGGLLLHYGGSVRRAIADLVSDAPERKPVTDGGPENVKEEEDVRDEVLETVCRDTEAGDGGLDWRSAETRRKFLERVAKEHKVTEEKDWRRIDAGTIRAYEGGATLLRRFEGSVGRLIVDSFPDYSVVGVRERVPRNFWVEKSNRRQFLDSMAKKFGVKKPSDWRRVGAKDVGDSGGYGLLNHYQGSLYAALRDAYAGEDAWQEEEATESRQSKEWDIFRVRNVVPQQHWEEEENVRAFVQYVGRELGVRNKTDWYRVSREQVRSLGGGGVLGQGRTWIDVLRQVFPKEKWSEEVMSTITKKSAQKQMLEQVLAIFPDRPLASSSSLVTEK